MRALLQRVREARVEVAGEVCGAIGPGLLVLLGVHHQDGPEDVARLLDKILGLRIFDDDQGRMNRSLLDEGGALLVVSQFTLFADCRKGRRPSWSEAAGPELARALYEDFIARARLREVATASGVFQAMMDIHLVNHGPVTLLLDTRNEGPGKV
ncbi:MAG: D-tyrosyl-tRNA(Tyr) deacylase [Desulfobulbaceae bacterium A2]|nr:MAG: D-tyrosyl-tRNA(Tyr) deacylase [Desulfobulbaceae bacterium A2]